MMRGMHSNLFRQLGSHGEHKRPRWQVRQSNDIVYMSVCLCQQRELYRGGLESRAVVWSTLLA